jgi:hypothetical protein
MLFHSPCILVTRRSIGCIRKYLCFNRLHNKSVSTRTRLENMHGVILQEEGVTEIICVSPFVKCFHLYRQGRVNYKWTFKEFNTGNQSLYIRYTSKLIELCYSSLLISKHSSLYVFVVFHTHTHTHTHIQHFVHYMKVWSWYGAWPKREFTWNNLSY